jgi:hypothetical protein
VLVLRLVNFGSSLVEVLRVYLLAMSRILLRWDIILSLIDSEDGILIHLLNQVPPTLFSIR